MVTMTRQKYIFLNLNFTFIIHFTFHERTGKILCRFRNEEDTYFKSQYPSFLCQQLNTKQKKTMIRIIKPEQKKKQEVNLFIKDNNSSLSFILLQRVKMSQHES